MTTEELAPTFEAWLGKVPNQAIEAFAQGHPALFQGFRLGNVPVLRTRIAQIYRGALTGEKHLELRALFERMPLPEAMAGISAERLIGCAPAFAAYCGAEAFLLAAANDPRAQVRDAAARWLRDPAELMAGGGEAGQDARGLLRARFAAILPMGDGDAPPDARTDALRKQIADLRAENGRLARKAKEERQQAQAQAAEERRAAKQEAATKDFAIAEFRRRAETAESRLRKEEATREERVRRELALILPKAFEGWLRPCLAVEAALRDEAPRQELLARAEAALAKQAALDRASRDRAALEARLHDLEAMLARVDETLRHAHCRHADLIAVRADLAAACDALRGTLAAQGVALPDRDLPHALSRAIHALPRDERTATDLDAFLGLASRLRLLSGQETRALRTDAARIQPDAADWAAALGAIEDKDGRDDDPAARRNPALAAGLRGEAPLFLYLDGHNIINCLPSRYGVARGHAQTHAQIRERLEQDLRALLADLPLVQATLMWDGSETAFRNLGDNLVALFSGGEGEHRADRAILKRLEYDRSRGAGPFVVVTDDNGFAREAERLGAKRCRLQDFAAFLNHVPRA